MSSSTFDFVVPLELLDVGQAVDDLLWNPVQLPASKPGKRRHRKRNQGHCNPAPCQPVFRTQLPWGGPGQSNRAGFHRHHSAPVYVSAVNDTLYLTSTTDSSSTDSITYSLANSGYDSTDFSQASFPYAPITGTLSGNLNGGSSGGSSNSGVTIYQYSGSYDGVGNLAGYTDSTANAAPIMGTWTFGYDSLNRLVSGTPSSGPDSGQHLCWSYDPFGNRTAQVSQTSTCPSVSSPSFPTASYNGNNQVTWVQNTAPMGYSYDASGNATSDNTNTYLYDAEGRICAVRNEPIAGTWTMTGYLYDADGTRIAKGTIAN